MVRTTASFSFLKYEAWVAWSHSKKLVLLMKFLTRKYLASVTNGAVSSISFREAIEEPRMWKTTKVIWPFFTASRKPISRNERSVGDNSPARTSTTVTVESVVDRVSMIRIWSDTEVASTMSATSP